MTYISAPDKFSSVEFVDCQSGLPIMVNGAALVWHNASLCIDPICISKFHCWLHEPETFLVAYIPDFGDLGVPFMTTIDVDKIFMDDGTCHAMHWDFGKAVFWSDILVRSLSTSSDGKHVAILFLFDTDCEDSKAYGYLFHLEATFLTQLPVKATIQHGFCWSPCSCWLAYCYDDRDGVTIVDVGIPRTT